MKTNRTYVGVTGFVTPEEVRAVEGMVNRLSILHPAWLMVGVLMSEKTLRGLINKWPNRYPKRETVADLFSSRFAKSIIHYSTDHPDELLYQMLAIRGICSQEWPTYGVASKGFHGFQLNVAWPRLSTLEEYRELGGGNDVIVLQAGSSALSLTGNHPATLAAKLRQYESLVDYVLLDPSGGKGLPLDLQNMIDYVRAIKDAGIKIDVSIAGGLCAHNLRELLPLLEEFPDTSIDAEGRLRTSDDHLDLDQVKTYVSEALSIYSNLSR